MEAESFYRVNGQKKFFVKTARIYLNKLYPMFKSKYRLPCSWHQTTNQPTLFSPIFSTNSSSNFRLSSWIRKETFNWSKIAFFFSHWIKSLFSFSTAKRRIIRGQNWEEQDWLFDVKNKIFLKVEKYSTVHCMEKQRR